MLEKAVRAEARKVGNGRFKGLTVAVERQVILDQSIGHLLRHLFVGHDMLGEVLSSKRGAIYGGVNGVGDTAGKGEREVLEAVDNWARDFRVTTNAGEMNHLGYEVKRNAIGRLQSTVFAQFWRGAGAVKEAWQGRGGMFFCRCG